MNSTTSIFAGLAALLMTGVGAQAELEPGFTSLFDGKTLNGWTLVDKRGGGYGVTNGVIYCARRGGGNLFTDKEYSDFILRIEFLNDQLVVRNTTLENFWERDRPIYPIGQIELQNHGGPLWFRNIYIREIPHGPKPAAP